MKIDMHIHSSVSSCSTMTMGEIFSAAVAAGLEGICITDHGSRAALSDSALSRSPEGLLVVIAMEYTSPDGDFLLFGPFDDLEKGLSGEDLLLTVRERGGLAVAAHPCRKGRPVAERLFEKGLCRVIERLNGRNSGEENSETDRLIELYGLFECGGSDAHEPDEVGSVVTDFHCAITSEEELIAALQEGEGTARYNWEEEMIIL